MQNKIVEVDGKFGVKQIAENGDSLGIHVARFDTEAEAQAFADSLDRGVTPEEAKDQQPEAPAPEVNNNDNGGQA